MSDVWWCQACRVPLLKNKCENCGKIITKPFAKDIVPVFAEEMSMLRDKFWFGQLPATSRDFYLWNSGPNYYIDGQKVATLRYNNSNSPDLAITMPQGFKMPRWRQKRAGSYIDALYNANRSIIDAFEYEAMQFVQNTHAEYSQHVVMVAMSGGKDSTVVSEIVRKALGRSELLHVMSDTTIEAKDTYDYIDEFHKHNPKVPLVRLTPTMDFYELSSKIGPPSRLRRWCCTTHKASQMATIVSALRGSSPGVLTFDGVRSSESTRRAAYSRITHKHKIKGEILASPIKEWKNIHIWLYLVVRRIEFNKGYRFGFRRVGCLPCPFNSRWSSVLTQHVYPSDHEKWKQFLLNHAIEIKHPNPENFAEDGWRSRAGGRGMKYEVTELDKEVCLVQDRTFTYKLAVPWTDAFFEFLKPFGELKILHDDSVIVKGTITRHKKLLAEIKIVRLKGSIRVSFENMQPSKLITILSRFERQIKKFQSCILCGSCNMKCLSSAINANGKYMINDDKCSRCLECIKSECIALDSLAISGKATWRTCNG